MNPQVLVVRDQFALRSLSNQALSRVLPTYEQAAFRILEELKTLPDGRLERQLRLNQILTVIRAQVAAVGDRLDVVLPPAQAEAFIQGLAQADNYLQSIGATPTATTFTEGAGVRLGGVTITQQQLVAVARDTGFRTFPGLLRKASGQPYTIGTATAAFQQGQTKLIEARIREGFLISKSTSEIVSDVRVAMATANRRQVDALVRTSMAQASQTAHDAFNEANEDALGDKDGNRYLWDASNDGRLCPVCAPLAGTRYKQRKQAPWPAHWNERCRILPLTPLSDELDAVPQSFLEQTPVQYDEKGRRLPPPVGWTGENAYKTPRRINGQQYWVRRREATGSTPGHMLQGANDQTALGVLGTRSRLARFRKMTGPGGKYAKDPQGAVVELLRPGSVKKPAKPPKPKPPKPGKAAPLVAPAPVAPPPAPRPPAAPPAPPTAQDPGAYSSTRPRRNDKTTDDVNHRYRTSARKTVKAWTGRAYTPIRAAQIKAAKANGSRLTAYARKIADGKRPPDAELPRLMRLADELDEFITTAPVYKGGPIYRGVSYPDRAAFMEDLQRIQDRERSLTIESWTTEESVTYLFSKLSQADLHSVTYVVEDNLHGVPIQSLSRHDREYEVLMPTGVRYEVVRIEQNASPAKSSYGYQPVAQGEFTRVVLRQVPAGPR